MRPAFQKSLSVLLALFFSIMAGWQGASSLANPAAADSPPSCHCCNSDRSNCATPVCCSRPADSRAPVTPAAPRLALAHDSQLIAAPSLCVFTLPRSTAQAPTTAFSSLQVGAVPIFQRDCSFLL